METVKFGPWDLQPLTHKALESVPLCTSVESPMPPSVLHCFSLALPPEGGTGLKDYCSFCVCVRVCACDFISQR